MKRVPTDILSLITNSWVTPENKRAASGEMDEDSHVEFPQTSQELMPTVQKFFQKIKEENSRDGKKMKLYLHMLEPYKKDLALLAGLQLIIVFVSSIKPMLIAQFLLYLDPTYTGGIWFGNIYYITALLIVSVITKPVLDSLNSSLMNKLECRYWNFVFLTVYTKLLTLSSTSRLKYNMGNIMNLAGRDSSRLLGGLKIIQDGFFPIFLILVNFAFVYTLLGVTAVYAALFYFLMIVPMIFLILTNTKFTTSKNILSDSRGNLLREILKNIKNIKFCNIESYFSKSVFDNIAKDVKIGKKIYKVSRLQMTFTKTISTFLTGLTFILYSVLGNTVSPAIIFPTYMYLDEICNQFDTLQKLSGSLLNTYESYQIMKDFLLAEERTATSQSSGDADVALELQNVTWKWRDSKYVKMVHDRKLKQMRYISKVKLEKMEYTEDANTFELQNLNVTIKKGSLVGIVGAVGAGKSTLFSGLVDELRNMSGKATINGEIAYFTQEPWIMSDDIKTNITFGREVDFARLEQVVKACGMVKDLNAMKDGVYTKLGESGINLSGGQKARVALARCLYSDADIFLLDDPLAALDAYVGRQVFEHAIKRDLSGKTVLLATHQLQYMQQVDHIIVLDQGKVAESGSYEDLMGKNGVFSSLMAQFHTEDDASAASTVRETAELDAPLDKKPENVAEFVKKEKKETGNIPWSLYSKLFNGINTRVWFPVFGVLFVLNFAVDFLGLLVITWWADDNTRNAYYERLLLTTTIGRSVVFCEYPLTLDLLNIVWFLSGLDNYKFYFVQTFDSVVQAPLYFHEETPIGRILTRFGMDLTALDHGVFGDIYACISTFLSFLGKSVFICLASPLLIVLLLFTYSITIYIRKVYDAANLEFQRFFSLYFSTGDSINAETLSGLTTIGNFPSATKMFEERYYKFFDKMGGWIALLRFNTLWFRFRVNMLNSLITISVIVSALVFNQHSTYFSALVGLGLLQADSCTAELLILIYWLANWKSNMNSFQRVIEYIKETPKEAAMQLDSDPKDKTWPSRGVVEINRLCMAYHSKPERNVISDLCISIKAGEKIGVVGRTGSGKSTLALAFFRILEPKSGSIVVDGRDITQLGLKTLRRSIDIIAQEANIFSGTIRYNLTLDCAFSDEELWRALELVGMKEYVSQLPERLEHEVIGSGSNLSSGQGQLLCLARVLIRQPKLLILDEASSSIDGEADKLLQTVLRKTLKDATIISIAHRLNTIADFDRVLVLDQGDMKEFDSPHVLLQDPSSAFSKLAESSGAANAAAIRDIARKAYQKARMQE
ncbi:hypothetical protein HK103_006288 [Boothiomyces macroporosus]|uniref:Uncharacterized protein n=1 Tax=Boothiomyces macroporosus TaxID=261099 RepID=A0AAD5UH09_9FUNG|nr:hypothetical protein HK103_006288 [Boothiomyces macroporosus]